MSRATRWLFASVAAVTLALPPALSDPAAAQSRSGRETQGSATSGGVPNALQGFSRNRHQPIQIEASSLEVNDKSRVATFRGQVHVTQGDTELRCNTLVVHYEGGSGAGGAQTALAGADAQRIRLLEAKGNVVVTQKDQVATGDTGVFDMRKNTITLRGNVVVSQGRNVLKGDRLVVDMTTAVSRVESDKGGGRVQGLFQPSEKEGAGSRRDSIMPRLR